MPSASPASARGQRADMGATLRVIAWVTLLVAAELAAFIMLQKSVEEGRPRRSAQRLTLAAMVLFGVIVPLCFKKTLEGGSSLAISNLYWICLSQIGSAAVGYFLFAQAFGTREWVSTALLFSAVAATLLIPLSAATARRQTR